MPQVLDIEQSVLLLEIDPPFDKRDVQLARRRLAKQWHPDIAPPGKQLEHERHLKAINEAADQLSRARRAVARRQGLTQRGQGQRRRRPQAPRRGGRRAPTPRSSASARRRRAGQKHDPFGSRVPDHSVVHRYARCLSYPEWGVGSVNGIYFTGGGDDIQQWARVSFQLGIRTVPAGSLQFVDFSKPDPGAERVERFMTAAKHALAEGNFELAARRLVFARDADPSNTAGPAAADAGLLAGGRLQRRGALGARLDPRRARAARALPLRGAHLRGHGRAVARRSTPPSARPPPRPTDASAWERLGRLRMRTFDRAGAREALERARTAGPSVEGLLDLALVANLSGDVGAEVTACEQATQLAPESEAAWARYAHALARTDRVSDCLEACDRALKLADDPEVRDLRDQVARARAARAARAPNVVRGAVVRSGCSGSRKREHEHQRGERDDRHEHGVGGVRERDPRRLGHVRAARGEPVGVDPRPSRAVSSAPSAATASAPPIERKNWIAAVATPRSDISTAFWVAITNVWNIAPMPMPITTRSSDATAREESAPSSVSRMQPISTSVEPTIGKIL